MNWTKEQMLAMEESRLRLKLCAHEWTMLRIGNHSAEKAEQALFVAAKQFAKVCDSIAPGLYDPAIFEIECCPSNLDKQPK